MRTPSGVCLVVPDDQALSNTAPTDELLRCEVKWRTASGQQFLVPVREDSCEPAGPAAFLRGLEAWNQIFPFPPNPDSAEDETKENPSLTLLAERLLDTDKASEFVSIRSDEGHRSEMSSSEDLAEVCHCDNFGEELTEQQRELVALGLQMPEYLLIQGPPASGKKRVLAELIRQWLRRRLRVVVTAPRCEVLEQLARQLVDMDRFLAVFVPGTQEETSGVPEGLRSWLAPVRAKNLAARLQSQTEACQRAGQTQLSQLQEAIEWLTKAEQIAISYVREENRLRNLRQAREKLVEQLRRWLEDSATIDETHEELRKALDAEKRKHEAVLADLHQRIQQAQERLQQAQHEREVWQRRCGYQQQVVAIKRAGAFWKWLWWRNLFQAKSEERLAEFQARLREAGDGLQHCERELRQLEEALHWEHQRHVTTRERIIKQDLESRCALLDQEVRACETCLTEALSRWQDYRQKVRELWPAAELAELPVPESVQVCRERALACAQKTRQHLKTVHGLHEQLESLADTWAQRLPYWSRLLLAPWSALLHDPSLRRTDWMIVLQAHELPEATWEQLRDGAARWVLCGEPAWLTSGAAHDNATSTRAALHALWENFGGTPLWAPYRWWQTGAGISCQMTGLLSQQPVRSWTEPLADQPDVLLRFYELPDGQRVLAEVFFPSPKYDIRQAKMFLAQQMEEVILWPGNVSARWREDDRMVALEWLPTTPTLQVSYELGVHEELSASPTSDGRTAWRTVRVVFEKRQGWNLESARDWLSEWSHISADPKAAWLWCWHGGVPPLGDWPNWVLGLEARHEALSGLWRVPRTWTAGRKGNEPARRRHDQNEVVDLASEQRKRLPLAWQCVLPARGLIYPNSARELMQLLRELLPTLAELAPHWAVVGWWDKPQIELLRLLAADCSNDLADLRWQWLSVADCRQHQAQGVLVVLDSLRQWSGPVQLEHWMLLGALAERCLVLLEPDYQKLYRHLNARQRNSVWLSELLGRVGRLPVLTARTAAVAAS
ncbi:MAG: hypothetical protein RMJ19_06770 [Gemmatales bacterium]|nr:hypothetical protein [Gemmatales bacterium]MDW8175357.1 hypothetical protein [Gemmatales bacterium]